MFGEHVNNTDPQLLTQSHFSASFSIFTFSPNIRRVIKIFFTFQWNEIDWNYLKWWMDDDDNLRLKFGIFYCTSAIFTMCTLRQSYTERMTQRHVCMNVQHAVRCGSVSHETDTSIRARSQPCFWNLKAFVIFWMKLKNINKLKHWFGPIMNVWRQSNASNQFIFKKKFFLSNFSVSKENVGLVNHWNA